MTRIATRYGGQKGFSEEVRSEQDTSEFPSLWGGVMWPSGEQVSLAEGRASGQPQGKVAFPFFPPHSLSHTLWSTGVNGWDLGTVPYSYLTLDSPFLHPCLHPLPSLKGCSLGPSGAGRMWRVWVLELLLGLVFPFVKSGACVLAVCGLCSHDLWGVLGACTK